MKKIFLLTTMVFVIQVILTAQEKFVQGNIHIGHDIYDIRINDEYPIIGISNLSKNKKAVPQPSRGGYVEGVLPIEEEDKHADTVLAKSIIMDVLKSKLVALRENKDFIKVSYVFYQNGEVMNIDYILPQHTLITPREIAEIDHRLRKEIKAWFTGRDYKEYPAIYYNKQRRIYF